MPCCAVATSYGPPGGRYKRGGGGGHGEGCRATSSACGLRGAFFDSPPRARRRRATVPLSSLHGRHAPGALPLATQPSRSLPFLPLR